MKPLNSYFVRLGGAALAVFLGACGGGGDVATFTAAGTPPQMAGQSTAVAATAQTLQSSPHLPSVCRGFHVDVYSSVIQPMKLSFGPDGALYVGRDGGDRIHRIAPGGHSVAEFGPPMVDPDAVLVDTAGLISGVRNSVLVGGGGILAAISQNQTSRVIFNSGFADVDDMKFDHRRRLVFSDDNPQVLISNGNSPVVLFSLPSRPGSVAISDDNRIFVALADGTIRIYNPNGTVANAAFATGLAGLDTYLAFGPGAGGFGNDLYVLNGPELLRFDRHGRAELIGSGFNVGLASGTGFVFGPDRALYVSEYFENRVLRISRGHSNHQCPRR